MAADEVIFSNDDMAALADKLDALADQFDEKERLLLLSLLSVAADRIDETTREADEAEVAGFTMGVQPHSGLAGLSARSGATLPSLGSGFRGAFSLGGPGALTHADVGIDATVMTRTGHTARGGQQF